jgi:hypothetical protein
MIPTGATDLREWFYELRNKLLRIKEVSIMPARYYCSGCGKGIISMNIETNESVYPKFVFSRNYPVCSEDCEVIVEDSFAFRVGVGGDLDDC